MNPATEGPEGSAPALPSTEFPAVTLNTSQGKIVLKLDAKRAPKTVANFLSYVRTGHYDGTIFHRVIENFMIQGGGYTAKFKLKPTRNPIENEGNNGLKNERGAIAMARPSDPHSASAQFFINVKDNPFLNFREKSTQGWGYAVFGKVVEGMDVVDRIRKMPTGAKGPLSKDVPKEDVVILSATVGP